MKKVLLVIPMLMVAVACSKVKTVAVLTEKWETGQHRTCMYGHEKLYCFRPDEIPSLQPPFTPYTVESHRAELVKDPRTDGGTYETQFVRHAPVDFSLWDCYKTGTGSPAVSCELKHQPTAEETAAFVKTEKEQQERTHLQEAADAYLMRLNPPDLIEACGKGEQTGGGLRSFSTKTLDLREDTHIKYPFAEFRFRYLGMHNGTGSDSCIEGSPSCTASYILDMAIRSTPSAEVWNLDMQIKYPEQALEFVEPIPCMFSQVQLLNSQPSSTDSKK